MVPGRKMSADDRKIIAGLQPCGAPGVYNGASAPVGTNNDTRYSGRSRCSVVINELRTPVNRFSRAIGAGSVVCLDDHIRVQENGRRNRRTRIRLKLAFFGGRLNHDGIIPPRHVE